MEVNYYRWQYPKIDHLLMSGNVFSDGSIPKPDIT